MNVLTIVTIRGIWSSAHHKADGDKVNVTINNYDDIVIVIVVIIVVGANKTKYDDEHEVAVVEHEIINERSPVAPAWLVVTESLPQPVSPWSEGQ